MTDNERQQLRDRFLEPETRCGHFVSVETKKLWKCMLDMLEIIVRICNENGLRWFLMSGTLLGAVRHAGFIPWDDDLDICLPRPDYEKLKAILRKELPPPLFLQDIVTDPGYPGMFCKVRNSATTAITPWWVENRLIADFGIFIDIHALDGLPKSPAARKICHVATRVLLAAATVNAGCPRGNRSRPAHVAMTVLAKTLGRSGVSRAATRLASFFPFGKTAECGLTATYFGYAPHRGIWPTEWFVESMDADFEYLRVKIPAKTDEILTRSYGDWRTPVKEGVSWHAWMDFDTERDWKTVLVEKYGYAPETITRYERRIRKNLPAND